jgi:hypothetical protein
MFCDKCGAKTPENFNFCPKCGHDLQKAHQIIDDKEPTGSHAGDFVKPVNDEGTSPENNTVDGLLWGSESLDEGDEESQEYESSEVGESLESKSTDSSASKDDDPPNKKISRSSGGKTIFWAFLISALIMVALWFVNNQNVPIKVHFIGNFGGYSITSQSGQKFQANSRGEYVYLDTFKLFERKNLKFTFALSNAKGPGAFYLDYDGYSLSPIDTTCMVRFKRTQSDLKLSFTLNPFVPGAFVVVTGKRYEFGDKSTLIIPKMKISSKRTLALSAGTNTDDININFSKSLAITPGEVRNIEKSYILKPHYKGQYNFKFDVIDELGKKVDKADIDLGYGDLKTKTDNGKGAILVVNPPVGSTFSPSVSKGLMSPIEDLKSGAFDVTTREYNYPVRLRVQDKISFTVMDLNGTPIKGASATSSDRKRGTSNSKGKVYLTAKNRGQLTTINIRRPGFIETEISVMVKAGENVVSAPVVMQPMNVRMQVVDLFTGRPIPDISIKIQGITGEIYTTNDPFQTLFDLQMGKTYLFSLKDHQKRYLPKSVEHKITSNGQLIDVLLEPRPRYINIHFTNASGKNLQGVETSLKSDKLKFAKSDTKGKVRYKVYADTSYMFEYEFKTHVGSRMIYMSGEWEVNQKIPVTFNTNLTVKASQGSPEIRILDPSTKAVFAKGNGTLTQSLPFETYLIECDCAGGKYEELVTLNKSTYIVNVDCELPIVKARGAETAKRYEEAARIYATIPSSDKYYCQAQERLFYLKYSEDMLDKPDDSGVHAKHVLDNSCQNSNNPYFCIDAFPQLLKDKDYEAAKNAVRTGFKNEAKITLTDRKYLKELLNYYEKLVLQDEAFYSTNLSDDEKCERLRTLYDQWGNMKQMVSNQDLLDNIDIRQSEVASTISSLGC